MEDGFPYTDALIYNHTQTNFDSKILLTNRSHTIPLHLVPGSSHTCDNILGGVNLPDHDFNNSMDQVVLFAKRATKAYNERELALEYSISSKNGLLQQIQQRDEVIRRLQEEIKQEKVRRSQVLYRFKRVLYEMEKLVMDYRKQLKDTNNKFEEYRTRVMHNLTRSDNAHSVLSTKGHDLKPCFIPIE